MSTRRIFITSALFVSALSGTQSIAFAQNSTPEWRMSSGHGACHVSKYYEATGQKIDIHFSSANKANVFLSSDSNLLNTYDADLRAVVSAEGANLGRLNPLILSSRKVVFKVFDAPSFIRSLNNASRINVTAGAQKWVFNAPAAAGLAGFYNRCFPGQNIAEPAIRAASPSAASISPRLAVASVETPAKAAQNSGGLFNFIGDVFNGGDKSSGFERISRKPLAEEAELVTPAPQQASLAPRLAPTAPRSLATEEPTIRVATSDYGSRLSPAPTPSINRSYTPVQSVVTRRAAPQIIDAGHSCGPSAGSLPPELQSMAGYIAGGQGNNANSDSELIASLQQKMMLLEHEKESLRTGKAEQPSPLSLVRVCTQEKGELSTLSGRLEELEARIFELSQQQLQDQIALEDSNLNVDSEELDALTKENQRMRQRMQDMQADLNKIALKEAAIDTPVAADTTPLDTTSNDAVTSETTNSIPPESE